MKKQLNLDTTDAIIADVEKNHRCVIKKNVPTGERHKKPKRATLAKTTVGTTGSSTTVNFLAYQSLSVVQDQGTSAKIAAGTRASSTAMKLSYHQSISFVNDKEVKLPSGQKITIVVGDLAQQTVYLDRF